MHYVGQVDWSFTDQPLPASATSMGLSRATDRRSGPGRRPHRGSRSARWPRAAGSARHIHSFEEALYVLAGELTIDIDGHVHRLVAGDYRATWRSGPGTRSPMPATEPVRWFSVNTPMRLDPAAGRRDTFFRDGPLDVAALAARGDPPALRRSRRSARSVTTTGHRHRPRRSGSPTRPTVARRPGWTRRSWPTAGSR